MPRDAPDAWILSFEKAFELRSAVGRRSGYRSECPMDAVGDDIMLLSILFSTMIVIDQDKSRLH